MELKHMYVVNRKGEVEDVEFDRILKRIQSLCDNLSLLLDPAVIAQSVINGMFPGISTSQLDELAAQTCAYMAATHPDFSKLAARIAISNLHKNTSDRFDETIESLHRYKDKYNRDASLISDEVYNFVMAHREELNNAIDYKRDFEYDYFAFKTLERSYLHRIEKKIVERPQHLLMRVACGINCGDLERVILTYELMSQKYFIHATPTLFNSGTKHPQMSSCFLLTMKEDSIYGIYETLKSCALISKTAGGIGLSIHNIRSNGSYIKGTNGHSNGIVPMLKVFNSTARYVDQGGGKRKGSIAVYLEPWHADIYEFLDLRKNHGAEELRARDLFYALWIPDLFMHRVEKNLSWSLFDPNDCPGLFDTHSEEFNQLYERYEKEGRAQRTVKAQNLWFSILQSQIETGTPFMLYKDSCNRKSNQSNLGTIRSSNLCTEIIQYTSPDEIAVCNLASLALPKYVVNKSQIKETDSPLKVKYMEKPIEEPVCDSKSTRNSIEAQAPKLFYENLSESHTNNKITPTVEELYKHVEDLEFDYQKLHEVTKIICYNLNKIIDRNYYPVEEARVSNHRHRPIGIGVQGLADVFMKLRIPFDSEEAKEINRNIFETIYHGALEASIELAKIHGTYETYQGSPASKGIIQFDFWEKEKPNSVKLSNMFDWNKLRADLKKYGLRNSLLLAPMPTASTSQILGNNESVEPYTSNIYYRRVLSGEFFVINPYLLNDLIKLNLWNETTKNKLIANNGSVQSIPEIPGRLKNIYKTVWEIKQKVILDMAADRGAFIDQSQSLNIYISSPSFAKLTSMHFYGWKLGLKTGQYYLRTTAATEPIKFTVDQALLNKAEKEAESGASAEATSTSNLLLLSSMKPKGEPAMVCKLNKDNKEADCLACGS